MKYLLLDRDGTINIDKDYLYDPDDLKFCPEAVEGLKRLQDSGVRFFIVTNQSGIGREIFSIEDYKACEVRLNSMLAEKGIHVDAVRFCPHTPDEGCDCRKPKLGMWESLKEEFPELNPDECIMVGDKGGDILFGKGIGCKTARLPSTRWPMDELGDYSINNLNELADIILRS